MTTAPTSDVLERLAERVETASGPDRELDAEIHEQAIGLRQYESIDRDSLGNLRLRYYPGPPGPEYGSLPRYTASLQAGRKLLLPGHTFAVGDCGEDDRPWACVTSTFGTDFTSSATTPALALTAACLRARAALAKEPAL